MRTQILILALFVSLCCRAKGIITVCDSTDKSPVAGASVISANGMILGATDNHGRILADRNDFPLSVRCLGYEASLANNGCDSVLLRPSVYMLSEVEVSPADRPVTRVVSYVREYCTSSTKTDSMQMFSEYMIEYYIAQSKVKGYDKSDGTYPNKLAIRRYARMANSENLDSIFRPRRDDDITNISFLENMAFWPSEPFDETEGMKAGAMTDTVYGKHFPKFVYRKSNNHFIVDCDALSDFKDHKCSPWFFKLLGLTMEFTEANWSLLYNSNERDQYGMHDFVYGTYHLHVLGKGKLLRKMIGVKDAIGIDCYMELYPIELQRLTRDEYLDLKKDYFKHREDFRIPDNVQPLAPAIQNLIERIDRKLAEENE